MTNPMTTPNPVDIGKLVEDLRDAETISAIGAPSYLLTETASALTALVKERDELLLDAEEFDRIQSIRNAAQDALEASVVALEAERDRLREALRPFAWVVGDISMDATTEDTEALKTIAARVKELGVMAYFAARENLRQNGSARQALGAEQ